MIESGAMTQAHRTAAVIFDCDGLLVDTESLHEESFEVVLAPLGFRIPPEVYATMVGTPTAQNFTDLKAMWPALDLPLDELIRRKDAAYKVLLRRVRPMPGAEAIVRALAARGVPLAIASSSPRDDVVPCLDALGVTPLFDDRLATVERVGGAGKPAPDLYLLAARMLGADPSACVAVEDSQPGLDAAIAAGMRCVAVPSRYTHAQDFSRAAAVVPSLEAVDPEWLAAL